MASFRELTAGIAHEIQNPLKLCQQFSDEQGIIVRNEKWKSGKMPEL
jgi:hypothetical protein